MPLSQLKKGPERWWNNFRQKHRRKRGSSGGSNADSDEVGPVRLYDFTQNNPSDHNSHIERLPHYLQGIRSDNSTGELTNRNEDPILTDQEKNEVLTLVRENNISMDFILEMKEAFLLFDKVTASF